MAKNVKMDDRGGFAEEAAQPIVPAPTKEKWRLKIGTDGRVVIPAAARAQMGLGSSGVVVAEIVDGELRMMSVGVGMARIRAIAMKYKKPGVSVVDEFIAERRAEAAREND
jgi:bifunctional DNA-binding transcriptional regulator/antitoxin component of YhaV-PrlF toxin-antitoxin module